MTEAAAPSRYPIDPIVQRGELPDLFARPEGGRIAHPSEWPARGAAWRDRLVELEYGGLPPPPDAIRVETLSRSQVRRLPDSPNLWTLRLQCAGGAQPFSFCVRLFFPHRKEPVPVIVNGDACWGYLADEILARVLERGYALAVFNRTEMAEDLGYKDCPNKMQRSGGLYEVYPGGTFGALSAWAWGYHRCVDLIRELSFLESGRIAVTGHSRGGKTTLLAGATDARIAVVNDNASCAGGSAAFRYVGHGGETLNIANVFPSWFGPALHAYVGREETLPFDQHALLAAVAPRPLLLTYATDDRWSNPEGMVQCAWAAGEVYRFLGAADRLAFHLRPGGHAHAPEDWAVLLDFLDWQWKGLAPQAPYNRHPYDHLKPVFSWKAPGA